MSLNTQSHEHRTLYLHLLTGGRVAAAPLQEVEQYFITLGTLLPGFHNFYWMGLQVSCLLQLSVL